MKAKPVLKASAPQAAPSTDLPVPPKNESARKAKRNADAYTGFVVMSALSTGVFLAGGGLTLWTGLRYGKAVGTEEVLRFASKNSDDLFDEAGEISRDAQETAAKVPGLGAVMRGIESRADSENQDIQQTIDEMRDEARGERHRQRKFLIGSAVSAGVGLVGMLIFISAAKIARHRGLMLFDGAPAWHRRSRLAPRLSPQEIGLQWSLRF